MIERFHEVDGRQVIVRTYTVAELPDEIRRKIDFTEMVDDPNVSKVIIVAKEGVIHDWAAYSGWPLPVKHEREDGYHEILFDYGNWIGVINEGDKLYPDDAKLLFPEWKDIPYRR